MARIPAAELERLKEEIALVRLVESTGVELKAYGADRIGHCPFHTDKTPSLVVSPKKNLWHCLGACQTGGTVIDWVMQSQGVSFRHAVEILQEGHPLGAVVQGKHENVAERSTTQKLKSDIVTDVDDQALLTQVIDFYHETLKASPEVLDYLKQRGLHHAALIDHFKLGFANRTLGYRLPAKNRKAGATLRGQLQRIGVIRSSGHEHFNGSLVIPVIDANGLIGEVYGRKVTPNLRKGTAQHLYLPGPHAGVFNLAAMHASKEIILCESLIDALTFWAAGFRNVTSSYGTAGFTREIKQVLIDHAIERVLIAYDRDAAGNNAADKLADELSDTGIACFRILFPKGMDANEYALKVTPATQSLSVAIRKAEWITSATAGHCVTAEPVAAPEVTTAMESASFTVDDNANVVNASSSEMEDVSNAVAGDDVTHDSVMPSLVAAPLEAPSQEASPLPAAPASPADSVDVEQSGREAVIVLGDRCYRVRGFEKNLSFDQLRVNVLVSRMKAMDESDLLARRALPACNAAFHVDTLDLYSARHRAAFIKQAALEIKVEEAVMRHDLGQVLLKLEALQAERIEQALEKDQPSVTLNDTERAAALELLRDPTLLDRILDDLSACGLVGEETNKLVGYLACVSRKLDRPLAVIIQSTSAAGKSALMEAVLDLMPAEEAVHYSAMTGQSLFYLGETDIKHKILSIAEETGVTEASYALKLLQSQGELSIASTGKDAATGKLVTQEYRVEGPVMLFLTTSAVEIDEELLNRCLVLTVNETREQTQAIHVAQRAQHTLEGLLAERHSQDIIGLHRNAQRLLRPLLVANPYAEHLSFRDEKTRMRRDHLKYLTLIRAITLLHQHQRVLRTAEHNGQKVEYIEVTLGDIRIANKLAHEVLGRTLDELPPQTRNLLSKINTLLEARAEKEALQKSAIRFTRREVREHTGWGNTQLKVHLHRLEEMEYLLVHRGGRGQSFVYELVYDGEGEDGEAFLMGLTDPDTLVHGDGSLRDRSGSGLEKSGPGRGPAGPRSARLNGESSSTSSACEKATKKAVTHVTGAAVAERSYRQVSPARAAGRG
jgi:DNA primase catalytic core